MAATIRSQTRSAFTLIELLVVISIVAILMGLAFPAFQGVQNAAKKTQAKNDLIQIVTAVNAFYTEYGKYPLPAAGATGEEYIYGQGNSSKALFDSLRGLDPAANPKLIVFLSPPDAKDQTNSRGGIKTSDGQFYDPWGKPYVVGIDCDYDNEISNPYSSTRGAASKVRAGAICWSLGKDGSTGANKDVAPAKDDVISWQ